MKILLLLCSLCFPSFLAAQSLVVSGKLTDAENGEALIGATVYSLTTQQGALANEYGFYSLKLDGAATYQIRFSALGYRDTSMALPQQTGYFEVSIQLQPASTLLSEVTVTATEQRAASRFENGTITLLAEDINRTPVLLGEKDILKSLQLMPGVANPREGFGGLFVRGGSPDQNLILLDDVPVYNAFHLFGFLSVFNPDAVRHVELHKGVFPARFGGRLASVLDLRMKEGNRKKFSGQGGIGLLAGRLTLEGPLGKKEKFSYLLSGRRSYADAVLGLLSSSDEKNIIAFHDANAKFSFRPNDKHDFFLSSYVGRDRFAFANQFGDQRLEDGFNWGNTTLTARWNYRLGDRAFLKTTLLRSAFDFRQYTEEIQNELRFNNQAENRITNLGGKIDLDLAAGDHHQIKTGVAFTRHQFSSAILTLQEIDLDSFDLVSPTTNATEMAVYVEDRWELTPRLTASLGLRWNGFESGQRFYQNLEPRLFAQYQLRPDVALRGGYIRSNQYLHLLSNSGVGLPTDLWVGSDDDIAPQQAWQVTAGVVKDWVDQGISVTVEGFYKESDRIIGYREGASFLVLDFGSNGDRIAPPDPKQNITTGSGRAYGAEFLLEYERKRFSGFLGYTYLKVEQQLAGVNNNEYFPANQDRRHDLNFALTYDWTKRLQLSLNWSYGSGVPTTLPIGRYAATDLPGFTTITRDVVLNGERNSSRLPSVHRLDLALRWYRSPRWGKAHWEFGLYNAYNRANPFYLRSVPAGGNRNRLVQVSLFPVIPSVSYNFSF